MSIYCIKQQAEIVEDNEKVIEYYAILEWWVRGWVMIDG